MQWACVYARVFIPENVFGFKFFNQPRHRGERAPVEIKSYTNLCSTRKKHSDIISNLVKGLFSRYGDTGGIMKRTAAIQGYLHVINKTGARTENIRHGVYFSGV